MWFATLPDGLTVYLKPGKSYRVGRKNLELTLNSKSVSRHHATITAEKADGLGVYNLTVCDENSKGGTFLNANSEHIPSKEPVAITKLPKRLSNSCGYAFLWLGKNRSNNTPREYEIQLTWVPLDIAYRVNESYAGYVEDEQKKMAALGINMSANMMVSTCMLVQPENNNQQERISNKLIYALTQGFPIVTPEYCTAVQKILNQTSTSFGAPGMAFVDTGNKEFFQVWSLNTSLIIKSIFPDPSQFVPENDTQLLPDPRRKKMFSGYIFGLWGHTEHIQSLKPIFEGGGGQCATHTATLPSNKDSKDSLIKSVTTFLDLLANAPENRNKNRVIPVLSEDPKYPIDSIMRSAAQKQVESTRSGPIYSGRVEVLQPATVSEIAEAVRMTSTTILERIVEIPEDIVHMQMEEEREDEIIPTESVKAEPFESPLKEVKTEHFSLSQGISSLPKPRVRNPYLSGLTKTAPLDDYVGSLGLTKMKKITSARAERTKSKKTVNSGKEQNLLDLWASMPLVEHKQDHDPDPDPAPVLEPEPEPEPEPAADDQSELPLTKRRRVSPLEIMDDDGGDIEETTKPVREPHKPEPQQKYLSTATTNLAQTSTDTAFILARQRKTRVKFAQAVLATKDIQELEISGDAKVDYTSDEVAAMRNLAIVDEMEIVEPSLESFTRAGTRDTVIAPCDENFGRGSMSESKWGLRPNFKSFRKASVYGSGSLTGQNYSHSSHTAQPSVFVPAVVDLVQANPNENRLRNNMEFLELDVRKKSRQRMTEEEKENSETTDPNTMALVRRRNSQDSLFVGGVREDEDEEEEEERLNRVFDDTRPAAKVSANEFSLVVAGNQDKPLDISSGSESDSDEEERNQLVVAKRRRIEAMPELRRDVVIHNGIVPRRPQSLLLGGPLESSQRSSGYSQRQLIALPDDEGEGEEEEEETNIMVRHGGENMANEDESKDEEEKKETHRLERPQIVIERRVPTSGSRRGGLLFGPGTGSSRNNTRTATTHGFLIEDEE